MANGLVRGIVSGGQTGADRAALEAAIRLGIPTAGWCPAGRLAEDGPIDDRYRLRETPSSDPAQRTAWNAYDADATLVLSSALPAGGTALAAAVAARFARPTITLDPAEADAHQLRQWLESFDEPVLLNVAGPRESEAPGIRDRVDSLLTAALAGRNRGVAPERAVRRALVTGGAGFLGRAVIRLAPPGWEVHGTMRSSRAPDPAHRLDLSDRRALRALLERIRPDLIVHTAYSVAAADRDIRSATRNVIDEATRIDIAIVHLSSDTVLDGETAPYAESARPDPISDYGRWKAEVESYVLARAPHAAIVRTSLITSFDPPDPRTAWVLAALGESRPIELFVDEIRCPILVDDLARQIWEIVRLEADDRAGVWHLAGPEAMSRFTLGTLIAAAFGRDPGTLTPATSASSSDPRPRDLRLLTGRADRALLTRARPITTAAAEVIERRTNRDG